MFPRPGGRRCALEEMLRAAGQLGPHADSRAEIETALSKFLAIIGMESRSVGEEP